MNTTPRHYISLSGRTALVTGSTQGIGKSILLALAQAGARVIIHGIEPAEEALAEVSALSGQAIFCPGDLSISKGGCILAAEVRKLLDGDSVDILVLNASIQIRREWSLISSAEALLQLQTNFLSSLELIQSFAPAMQAQRWGRILSIGSVQETKPHKDMAVYAASKAAQTSLIRNLARQLAPHGITANNIAPGVILTARNTEVLSDDIYAAQVRSMIPAGDFGQARDIASLALLLCSDASSYVTGQSIYADGGLSL